MSEMVRTFKTLQTVTASDDGVISGYASTFGNIDTVGDTITPGAYDGVISAGIMPAMFYDHNSFELPIGKWTSWHSDDKGLFVEGQLDLSQKDVAEIYRGLRFGSITGLSVYIMYSRQDVTLEGDGRRIINKVSFVPEISVVAMPADPSARIASVKSIEEAKTIRDFERCLRDAGASKTQAVALCAKAKALFGSSQGELEAVRQVQMQQIAARLATLTQKLEER